VTANERSLSYRTVIGSLWLIGSGLLSKSLDFITLLVLARILTPADFGLVAIAMSLIFVVEAVFEMPLNQALVRLPDLTRDHFDTVFTLGALRGLLLAAVLVVAAFPFAAFYKDPRLGPVICLLGVAPIARGLTSPRMVEFVKRINFPRDLIVDFSGKVVAMATATSIAIFTHSYWSIVAGTVASPLAMVVATYIFAPFRPRLSLREARSLIGFVGWSSATQMVVALNWQCDRLILGRFAAARDLGAFTMASDLATLPERTLIKALARPIMAAFALIRDDVVRLRDAYAKSTAAVMMVGLPAMTGLGLLASPTIQCVLGNRWLVAVPLLQWLAFACIPPLFTAGLGPLVMTLNRNRIFFSRSVLEFFIKLPLVAGGAIWFGLQGVVIARLLSDVALAVISMSLARELIGMSVFGQILMCWRIIGGGLAMAGALLFLRPLLEGLHGLELALGLIGVSAAGGVTYFTAIFGLWLCARRPAGLESIAIDRIGLTWRALRNRAKVERI
jgi:O-antigen/teichoic acid export membrane protein